MRLIKSSYLKVFLNYCNFLPSFFFSDNRYEKWSCSVDVERGFSYLKGEDCMILMSHLCPFALSQVIHVLQTPLEYTLPSLRMSSCSLQPHSLCSRLVWEVCWFLEAIWGGQERMEPRTTKGPFTKVGHVLGGRGNYRDRWTQKWNPRGKKGVVPKSVVSLVEFQTTDSRQVSRGGSSGPIRPAAHCRGYLWAILSFKGQVPQLGLSEFSIAQGQDEGQGATPFWGLDGMTLSGTWLRLKTWGVHACVCIHVCLCVHTQGTEAKSWEAGQWKQTATIGRVET